eukprot:3328100-Amphidinium_carterae.1
MPAKLLVNNVEVATITDRHRAYAGVTWGTLHAVRHYQSREIVSPHPCLASHASFAHSTHFE